jgi:phenylpropionate dioxygenase-like ring-hydroxylating dioxygenase large terminal subunit
MLKDYWYTACASSQLSETPMARLMLEENIVLFRDATGTARALIDRCCHRGVKLSLGKVKGGVLACGYHGWQFDGTGKCVHIPSLCDGAKVPTRFEVRSFPCVEQDHYVWIWMGSGAPVPQRPPALRAAQEYHWRQGAVAVKCSAAMFIENQLDGAHPPFAHKGTHPAYFFNRLKGFREYDYEVRLDDTGLVIFYPPTSSAEEPVPATADSVVRFELPNRVYVLQRGKTADLFSVLHMVPETATTCRIEWLLRQLDGGVTWMNDEPKTLEQDRILQESAQINYDIEGDCFERSVAADYATLLARKILHLAERGAWETGRATLTQRKLVHVRQ